MLGYRFHIGENLELNLFVEGGWKPTFQTWGNNNVPSQLDGWGAMGGAAFSFPTSPSEVKKDDAPLADDAGGGGGGGGNDNGEGSRVIVSNTPPLPEKECTECLPAVRDIAIAQTDYIFNYNEATFTEEGRTAILETGAAVKEAVKDTDMTGSEVLIILTGHASPEGKEEKNLALSKKRIAAAVELLQKEVFNNVNYPVLVVYKAKGETELKAVDLGEVDKKDRNTVVVNRSEDDWSLILVSEKDEKNPQEHTIGEGAAGKTHMSFEVGGKTYLVPLSENRRVSIIVRVILKTGLENEREWDGVQRIDTPPPAEPPPAEPVPTEPPPAQP
jgi:outer membrane protein OmpA-like peptidoglycan-associated protein